MSLLLYAIVEGDPAELVGEGLAGQPLRGVGDDGLVAVIGESGGVLELTEERARAYEQVVRRLMSGGPVLPARFGSMFASEAAARRMLRERRDELTAALARVHGAVELGVRASCPTIADDSLPGGPNAGTAYMVARLEARRRIERIALRVDRALRGMARQTRLHEDGGGSFAASYLVDRDDVGQFAARVQQLASAIDGEASLVCTGPWPPYSFVGRWAR
jgi:hypothetical protein